MIDWKTVSLENLAGFVSEELKKRGVDIILIGEACVTIYSKNLFSASKKLSKNPRKFRNKAMKPTFCSHSLYSTRS